MYLILCSGVKALLLANIHHACTIVNQSENVRRDQPAYVPQVKDVHPNRKLSWQRVVQAVYLSYSTTSTVCISCTARKVSSPGSPGPVPARYTVPGLVDPPATADGFCYSDLNNKTRRKGRNVRLLQQGTAIPAFLTRSSLSKSSPLALLSNAARCAEGKSPPELLTPLPSLAEHTGSAFLCFARLLQLPAHRNVRRFGSCET